LTHIQLPHNWRCRPYQNELWDYLNSGGKRAVAVWHRRAGKDQVGLHWTTVASQRRKGVYWHMLPTLRQARKVVWENIDGTGNRVMDAWPGWQRPGPHSMVSHIRHDEMKVELHNGSIWYAAGSDNYDSLMGTNPVGVVFSEWALSNPAAWDYVRPILSENGGWALFIYTPRGRNHGASMYEMARDNPDWFCQRLTVDDTLAITKEAIDAERRAGMAEELIQQEFWCSFDAPLVGSYWGDQLMEAQNEGRITSVPHDPAIKVDTWWDLGMGDSTAIWFVQQVAGEIHVIDYYETNGEPLEHYAIMLEQKQRERRFVYGRHVWPHDGGAKTLASGGRPLSSLFADLGWDAEVQPRQDVEVGIQRVRQVLPRCWFDEKRCANGLDALRAYRKELDEARSTEARPYFKPKPLHDWSSHGSDAFRTGAMTLFDIESSRVNPRRRDYEGKSMHNPSHWAA
jgi:hypothetical protein